MGRDDDSSPLGREMLMVGLRAESRSWRRPRRGAHPVCAAGGSCPVRATGS